MAPIGRGMFLHRVLLSDGTVMSIPFVSALIHNFPLQEGRQNDASRQERPRRRIVRSAQETCKKGVRAMHPEQIV